jgi:hypothetical protein
MSFKRSLAILVLSLVFTSAFFIGITSYTMGRFIERDSIKQFITDQGLKAAGQQCQHECNQNAEYQSCLGNCTQSMGNQVDQVVGTAIDELYVQNILGTSLNEMSKAASQYMMFIIIGAVAGLLLIFASEKPISTVGKDMITIAITLFISTLSTSLLIGYANLPLDLGKAFSSYLSPGFSQQNFYAIIFLTLGIVMLAANYINQRRKKK